MTSIIKNYNAKAAEMVGCKRSDILLPGEYVHQYAEGDFMRWNPLQDRNQAYQLLKRAKELGLADEVEHKIYKQLRYYKGLWFSGASLTQNNWSFLTCPTDIITMACVDVWLERQAEQEPIPEPASFSEDAKEKFYPHLDSYHLQKAQEENQQ